MTEGAKTGGKVSKRLRRLGVAALMAGGSAGAVAAIGGQASAINVVKCVPTSFDQQVNSRLSQLPNGVSLSACNGSVDGSVDPNTLIGKTPVPLPPLPVQKIHKAFPEPPSFPTN